MDQMLHESLKDIKVLVEENNKILRGMRRNARISMIWHIFYWLLIIGVSVGSYYYLQPYIEGAKNAYQSMQDTQQKITEIPQSFNLNALKNYFVGTSTEE